MVALGNGSTEEVPAWHRPVGITLALGSSLFIGSSFILKKKGLIDSNCLGEDSGHAYLKNGLWWAGMILMAVGEVANFGAYAFTPAILVAPLGAVSVVFSAVLSSIFLKERLDFPAKVGCAQCLLGAIMIVLNAPETNSTSTLSEFYSYVITPGFLVYSILVLFAVLYLIYYLAPRYGKRHPFVYILVCSLVGSYLVLSVQGFGSSLVYSATHWDTDNQFRIWTMYPLIGMVILTIIMQINYLNKALNLFSTAIVTPVYYVFFTTCTLITSAVLFRGFSVSSTLGVVSILIGFFVIVGGVALLFDYNLKQTKTSLMSFEPEFREEEVQLEPMATLPRDMDNKNRELSVADDPFFSDPEPGLPRSKSLESSSNETSRVDTSLGLVHPH